MLTSLYVGRSYHLWKDPNLLPWLERNVHQVIARVDTSGESLKSQRFNYLFNLISLKTCFLNTPQFQIKQNKCGFFLYFCYRSTRGWMFGEEEIQVHRSSEEHLPPRHHVRHQGCHNNVAKGKLSLERNFEVRLTWVRLTWVRLTRVRLTRVRSTRVRFNCVRLG
jgi:hypothetical protein